MERRRPCARCVWEEDENGVWKGGCGFEFICYGKLEENLIDCPMCMKRISKKG